MKTVRAALARVAPYEPWLLALCAPFLIFPGSVRALTVAALAAVALLWLARACALGRVTRPTPFDAPVFVLLVAALVGWAAAPNALFSISRATNLVLAVSLFYALVNARWTPARVHAWLWVLVMLAALVALGGVVGTDWNTYKYPALRPIYSRLPQLLRLPGTFGGIAPNELAGVLSAFMPAALALLWLETRGAQRRRPAAVAAAVLLLVVIAAVLLLAQARVALLAVVLVSAAGLARAQRWPVRWIGAVLLAAALALAGVLAWQPRLLSLADLSLTLADRIEVWQRALWTLRDMPFTGAGLGAWPFVSNALYGYQQWSDPTMGHPHNFLLSAPVEMGVLGLVATLGLFAAVIRAARCAASRAAPAAPVERALVFAGAGGLGVFALFGIADSIALGARPSALLWLLPATLVLTGMLPGRDACDANGPAAALRPGAASRPGETNRSGATSRRSPAHSAGSPARWMVGAAAAIAACVLLWPVLIANIGFVTLTRALWYGDGYVLATANPQGVSQAQALLAADVPGAWNARAFVYAAQGHEDEAVAAWRQAGVGAEDLLARGLWTAGHPAEAPDAALWQSESQAWYARAEALATGSHRAMVRALVAQRAGQTEDAIAALEDGMRVDTDWLNGRERMSALFLLGSLQLQLGHYPEARQWLARLADEYRGQINPLELAGAEAMLGRSARAQGDASAALAAYTLAAQDEPENPWRHFDLATIRYESGDRAGALQAWSHAQARAEQDDWLYAAWADFLARRAEWDALQDACASAPRAWQERAGMRVCGALLAWRDGRYEDALTAMTALRAQRPRDGLPCFWLGRLSVARGDAAGALEPLGCAVRLAPDDVLAWLALGDARAALGDATFARSDYTRALALRPGDADILARLQSLPR